MAVKTFTSGEVLTASDTNTYLANSGLVYITSATVGTAVSSVTVSNVFSSTYDNYKVIYSGGVGSGTNDIALRLGSTTTGYYYGILYNVYSSGTPQGAAAQNATYFAFAGVCSADQAHADFELFGPNLAKNTIFKSMYVAVNTVAAVGPTGGYLANTTQYTAFTLIQAGGGTLTGGTITVYGYRKA